MGLASLPKSISELLDSDMLGGALYMIIIFQLEIRTHFGHAARELDIMVDS